MKISTRIVFMIFITACISGVYSCEVINPEEGIPAYLQVDTFTFSVQPGQGSASTNITDVWVYDEINQIGAYEMPKTFPVLDSGSTSLIIGAGIWDNGISETRVPYPFYYPDTFSLLLEPAVIYPVTPHFTYRSNTQFLFIEDFEAGNIFSKINGDTNMVRSNVSGEVFEGLYSAVISLDTANTVYEGQTATAYVPSGGQPIYLELNYKCDQNFDVGIYASSYAISAFYYKWHINSKDSWNKIYLSMGADVGSLQPDEYRILIRAVLDPERTNSKIYLDNIKLVTF